ncbi:MAG TPA: hypothetical protein VIR03_01925 [Candidatus Saccharimonadales bacterium]
MEQTTCHPVRYVGSMYSGLQGMTATEADIDAILAEIAPFEEHQELLSHIPVGERRHSGYVQPTVNRLAHILNERGAAQVLQNAPDADGLWASMEERTRLRMLPGVTLQPNDLDYYDLALQEWRAFQAVRDARRSSGTWDEGWRYQYSVPSPASLAIVLLGPQSSRALTNLIHPVDAVASARQIFGHYQAIHNATVEQVGRIAQGIPAEQSVAQIEATAEMLLVTQAHKLGAGRAVARAMGGLLAKLVSELPSDVAVDLHACTGSLNNEAETGMRTLEPFVLLVNAMTAKLHRLDPNRKLLHVHCPVARSDAPARTDERYYRPLAGLEPPVGMAPYEFYAGLANRCQPLAEQQRALALTRKHLPGIFDVLGVSTSCGMGRYSREAGIEVHQNLARLALGE